MTLWRVVFGTSFSGPQEQIAIQRAYCDAVCVTVPPSVLSSGCNEHQGLLLDVCLFIVNLTIFHPSNWLLAVKLKLVSSSKWHLASGVKSSTGLERLLLNCYPVVSQASCSKYRDLQGWYSSSFSLCLIRPWRLTMTGCI
jgi:hypothetical protein